MGETPEIKRAALMTAEQLAACFDVSRPILRRALRNGQILTPTVMIGTHPLWLVEEVKQFVDAAAPHNGPRWEYMSSREGMMRLFLMRKDYDWWKKSYARVMALPESWWHLLKKSVVTFLLDTRKSTLNSWLKERLFPPPLIIGSLHRWPVRDIVVWLEHVKQAKGWGDDQDEGNAQHK